MSATYKFKVTVVVKDQHSSKKIYPIIEATSSTEAQKIAKAQYPNADVRSASKT